MKTITEKEFIELIKHSTVEKKLSRLGSMISGEFDFYIENTIEILSDEGNEYVFRYMRIFSFYAKYNRWIQQETDYSDLNWDCDGKKGFNLSYQAIIDAIGKNTLGYNIDKQINEIETFAKTLNPEAKCIPEDQYNMGYEND